jgi:transposase-like protein
MNKKKRTRRVIEPRFRERAVKRMESGENVCALSRELGVRRSVLYRWRDAWRREGAAGLSRSPGRPAGRLDSSRRAARRGQAVDAAAERIAELERLVGRQAAQISFLKRAFEQVSAGQAAGEPGASGSTRPSAGRSSEKAR